MKSIEAMIAETGARQHGVVTRAQLIQAGLTADAIRSRVRAGRLLSLHRGVYLLGTLRGPLLPVRHREMAAMLACGRGAVVARRSALWLLELVPCQPPGPVHVLLARGRCRQPGVLAHRVASIPGGDVEIVERIRTTTPIRSILDTAADARPRELEQIIARAERLGRLDTEALRDRLERERGRPGTPLLRAILAGPGPAFTRSPAEDGLLALLREAGLPEPECNVVIFGHEADFFWRNLGVAVEVDGYAYHHLRHPFERDRGRGLDLAARGIEVHRVTWRQIREEPLPLVRRLTAVLTRAEVRRSTTQASPAVDRAETGFHHRSATTRPLRP